MSRHSLGIPDLPLRAFIRGPNGHIKPQGKGGGKPGTPDYRGAAEEEAQGNLEMARYATVANRPNQYTPWGSVEWTNDRTFNQAGFDAANAAYQQSLAQPQQSGTPEGWMTVYDGSGSDGDTGRQVPYYGAGSTPGGAPGTTMAPPNAADFYTGGDNWSSRVTLSPEMQALFDQQNQLQQGLFGAQDAALGRVNSMMGQGFDLSALPQAPTARGSVLDPSQLTAFGQMGDVLNTGALPGMAQAFQASGQALNTYDPTLNTNNATELIMQRLNPQLEQQQEGLRAQLANQGIVQGTEAYDRAMMQFMQGRNDAQRGAALEGINLGMQQQGLQFNQGLQNRGLLAAEQAQQYGQQQGLRQLEAALQAQRFGQQTNNYQLTAAQRAQQAAEQAQQFGQNQSLFAQQMAARERALQEQAYLRSLPMNELNALRTGNQVSMPQFNSFVPQATTGGPQYMGAAQNQYNAELGAYNAQQASGAGMMSGLFGIGATLLGAPQTSILGGLLGG